MMNLLLKKEPYLSEELVSHWLQELSPFRKRHFHPLEGQVALLLLDLQEYFLSRESPAYVPSSEYILPRLALVRDAFFKRKLPVYFTAHGNTEEDAAMMGKWWSRRLEPGTPWHELSGEISKPSLPLLHKTQYDAFYHTALEEELRRARVKSLVIGGVMTHLCVETTVRSAFVRGFFVYLLIDGTATYNRNFHWASLLNLSHGFALPVTCKELVSWLKSPSSAQDLQGLAPL